MARHDGAQDRRGANAWSVLAADPERDLVFVPTGSAAPDYYGALRLGDNRYANSIVALKASTGQRGLVVSDRPSRSVGLRQRVAARARHRDAGRRAHARRAAGEQDRHALRAQPRDRAPIFPVEERAVPASDIPVGAGVAHAAVHWPPRRRSARIDSRWMRSGGSPTPIAQRVARRSRGFATKASSRRRASAGTLVMPVEHRRRALGRRRRRSGAGDRHRSGEPDRGDGAADPAGGIRSANSARATEQRLGDDYEYNMMRGTPYIMRRRAAAGAVADAVHAASVRHAGRGRSQDRPAVAGRCRSDPFQRCSGDRCRDDPARVGLARIWAGRS